MLRRSRERPVRWASVLSPDALLALVGRENHSSIVVGAANGVGVAAVEAELHVHVNYAVARDPRDTLRGSAFDRLTTRQGAPQFGTRRPFTTNAARYTATNDRCHQGARRNARVIREVQRADRRSDRARTSVDVTVARRSSPVMRSRPATRVRGRLTDVPPSRTRSSPPQRWSAPSRSRCPSAASGSLCACRYRASDASPGPVFPNDP
jgi:hypothetical protein